MNRIVTYVTNIVTSGNKDVPQGTELKLRKGVVPGAVEVAIRLPGRDDFSGLGNIVVRDGIVELPVKLIFFCYAREDQARVAEVADRLEKDNFLIYFDKKTLLPGDDWKAKIAEGIEKADFVLVFLSKMSTEKTGYVHRELKYALEQRQLRPEGTRYIIPVMLEQCAPPRELRDIQWLEISEEGSYSKLVNVMKG